MRGLYPRLQQRRVQRKMAGAKLLSAFARAYTAPFFIEIGSNDGEQHDHLRPFILSEGWKGIMVEPVPYVFERLRRNYEHVAGVTLDRVAIADHDGVLSFHHLREAEDGETGLPQWYDGIGSFSRKKVLTHRRHIPDIDERLISTEVPCLTFDSLCRKHEVRDVDLLVIDVEGYDAEVLRHIDFAVHRPRLLVYEHFHLQPPDRAATLARLQAAGYETLEEGFDTWCLRTTASDSLTRTWRRLRPAVPGLSALDEPS